MYYTHLHQLVNSAHIVIKVAITPIADVGTAKLCSVTTATARIRSQDDVSFLCKRLNRINAPRSRITLCEDSRRPAMDVQNERIVFPFLIIYRIRDESLDF